MLHCGIVSYASVLRSNSNAVTQYGGTFIWFMPCFFFEPTLGNTWRALATVSGVTYRLIEAVTLLFIEAMQALVINAKEVLLSCRLRRQIWLRPLELMYNASSSYIATLFRKIVNMLLFKLNSLANRRQTQPGGVMRCQPSSPKT